MRQLRIGCYNCFTFFSSPAFKSCNFSSAIFLWVISLPMPSNPLISLSAFRSGIFAESSHSGSLPAVVKNSSTLISYFPILNISSSRLYWVSAFAWVGVQDQMWDFFMTAILLCYNHIIVKYLYYYLLSVQFE